MKLLIKDYSIVGPDRMQVWYDGAQAVAYKCVLKDSKFDTYTYSDPVKQVLLTGKMHSFPTKKTYRPTQEMIDWLVEIDKAIDSGKFKWEMEIKI